MLLRQTHQRDSRSAFTLMEMLIVVAIIVALAGIGGYYLLGALAGSQEDLAKAQVSGPLTNACQSYYIKNKTWPPSLAALTEKDPLGGGPYLESTDALKDPWGQPYQYDASGSKNKSTKPDIWATSPTSSKMIGNWPSNVQH
jgi:general secretion pathway protein G